MERLASGLRINRAADDPAGLAMATSMSAKLRSNSQALRNINDGISVTTIADGAMQETDNILIRMRELTIQSMTGTLSANDRKDIKLEMTALSSQIDAIANGTNFNGRNLLGQSTQTIAVQTGINPTDTVDILLKGTRVQDIGSGGSNSFSGSTLATSTLTGSTSGAMSINGVTVNPGSDSGSTSFANGSARALSDAINGLGIKNLTASSTSGSFSLGTPSAVSSQWNSITKKWDPIPQQVTINSGSLVINGQDIGVDWRATDGISLSTAIVNSINSVESSTGVRASDNGGIYLQATNPANGYNIQVQSNGGNGQSVFSGFNLQKANDLTAIGTLTIKSERAYTIEGGLNGADQGWSIDPGTYAYLDSLEGIDLAMTQLSEYRANVGTTQNRLESEARNVQNQYENLSTAQSRIIDTDVAQETADLVKNNILRQAGLAILSQANQMPNLALSLLRQM